MDEYYNEVYTLMSCIFTPFFLFLFGLACMPDNSAWIFFTCAIVSSIFSFFGIHSVIKKHKDKEGE